jgi:hypothetical protein
MSQIKGVQGAPPMPEFTDTEFADLGLEPELRPPDVPIDEDEELTHEELITMFLQFNPTPNDEQVHQLAELVGVPFEQFEEIVFKMFGDIVGDAEDEVEGEEFDDVLDELEDDTDEDIDACGMFLISFFLRNPNPSEEQIHKLAAIVGTTPAELEERIYKLLADLTADEDAEEDAATSANDPPRIVPNSDGNTSPIGEY